MRICPGCSRESRDDVKFCPNCGVSLADQGSNELAATLDPLDPGATTDSLPGIDVSPPAPARPVRSHASPVSSGSAHSSLASSEHGRFTPGDVILDRYRIIARLGAGAMGEVYRADDLTLGQAVALKFLPEGLSADERKLELLRAEVRLARQIAHPNVCRVYDIAEYAGVVFLSMEYIAGEDLSVLLRRIGRLPQEKGLDIAKQIGAGLHAAHHHGIVHRDLKPANIMLDENGQVRIMDFGLAIPQQSEGNQGVLAGTPAYMAPEQLRGERATTSTDIYAYGLILYELFVGQPKEQVTSIKHALELRSSDSQVSVLSSVPELDPVIDDVIRLCTAPKSQNRPSNLVVVLRALPGDSPIDPLMTMGQLPSPEQVAQFDHGDAIHKNWIYASLVVFVATLVGILSLASQTSRLGVVNPVYPPQVTQTKAREFLQVAGYARGVTSYYGVADVSAPWNAYQPSAEKGADWKVEQREKLKTGQPALVVNWYNEFQDLRDPNNFFSSSLLGGVSSVNPGIARHYDPLPGWGTKAVQFDAQGRLVLFQAFEDSLSVLPRLTRTSTAVDVALLWDLGFKWAGLDRGLFAESNVNWIPPVPTDARVSFKGVYPQNPEITVYVECGALNGRLCYFAVLPEWQHPGGDGNTLVGPSQSSSDGATTLFGSVLVLALIFGFRNIQSGRADRETLVKLAVIAFLFSAVAGFASLTHEISPRELRYLFFLVVRASFTTFLVVIPYAAVEPFARRFWPQYLISSTRLLKGEFRDAAVGRDLMIGIHLAILLHLADQFLVWAPWSFMAPKPLLPTPIEVQAKAIYFLAFLFDAATGALTMTILVLTTVMVLIKILLKKDVIVVGVLVVLLMVIGFGADREYFDLLGFTLVVCGIAYCILRFGALMSATWLFCRTLILLVATPNSEHWYATTGYLSILAIVLLYGFAVRSALAGRNLFSFDRLTAHATHG